MVQFFQGSVQGAVIEVVQDGVPLGEGAALAVLAGQAHGMVFREQTAPCQGFRHGPVQQAAFPEGFPAAGQEAFFQRGVGREAVRKFRKDTSDALEQFRTDSRPRAGAREGRFIRILRGGGQDVVRGVFLHLQVGLFHALPKVIPNVPLLLFRQFPALPERHSVQGGGGGARLNPLGLHGRGEGGLVRFIVAQTAVTVHVQNDVPSEFLAELEREVRRPHQVFRAFSVDMQDGRLEHLGHVRGVAGGAGFVRAGGEADLVVDDEVHGAARAVTFQQGEIEDFRHDALS